MEGKKATPWKPSHELLQISVAAHVKDGFRIHCRHVDLDRNVFTTEALDNLRSLPRELRDITTENVRLLNRDAIYYIEFVSAIKKGDIGRVVNVLRLWMVMMRSPKTMPKYADAIFETLGRIDRYDPVLKRFFLHNWLVNLTGCPYSFKEVDLLQEHQNFWAKIIYNAKGSNKSWDWLSMITVCIFTLRDTMRTVQKSFNIPAYGERHTVPDMSAEVQKLADALRDEKIQEDKSRAENLGFVDAEEDGVEGDVDEGEDSGMEDYEVTREDLDLDDEEPYADAAALMSAAEELVSHM
ncbi:hypothetical protein B0H10DRAFT_2221313 [Mycena sp. CBHHK59/15]|nr:hypothetical protein B0H10DRAFT_2221313 [Mycena sp. CBHHK59/15]